MPTNIIKINQMIDIGIRNITIEINHKVKTPSQIMNKIWIINFMMISTQISNRIIQINTIKAIKVSSNINPIKRNLTMVRNSKEKTLIITSKLSMKKKMTLKAGVMITKTLKKS